MHIHMVLSIIVFLLIILHMTHLLEEMLLEAEHVTFSYASGHRALIAYVENDVVVGL